MRVNQQVMDINHARILEGASRLMRERGVQNTSVSDVMSEAGMTHGGFYRHFKSKEDLILAGLRVAFDDLISQFEKRIKTEDAKSVIQDFKNLYLSKKHLDNPRYGCPIPSMGSDIARESNETKQEFTQGVRRIVSAIAAAGMGSDDERFVAALREISMLVGAVVIARSCNEMMGTEILEACKDK